MINKEMFDMTYGSFDVEIIKEILDIFINEHHERFEEMDRNLANGELELLGANAHGLKGSIAQLFAEEEQAVAQEVESMGKAKISDGLEAKYKELRTVCDALVEEVKAFKANY
jgi:HPt (histidine-containing phosphotransfer) domain-containing protein